MAAARSTPDYHALIAANMVLGGSSRRINTNLREGPNLRRPDVVRLRRMAGPFALGRVQTGSAQAIHESPTRFARFAASRPGRPTSCARCRGADPRGTRATDRRGWRAPCTDRALRSADDYFAQSPRLERVTTGRITRCCPPSTDPLAHHAGRGRLRHHCPGPQPSGPWPAERAVGRCLLIAVIWSFSHLVIESFWSLANPND